MNAIVESGVRARRLGVGLLVFVLSGACAGGGGNDAQPEKISHVHGVGLRPGEKTLYVATHFGLFARDAENWSRRSSDRADHMGFTVAPNGMLFRSGHPPDGGNLGVQLSRDRGRTWKTVSPVLSQPVDFHAMTASVGSGYTLYGWAGGRGVFRSRDEGKTWQRAGAAGLPEGVAAFAAPQTDGVVFASTSGGLYSSSDSGDAWQRVTTELFFAVTFAGDALYGTTARGSKVLRSTDGGATWQETTFKGPATVVALAGARDGQRILAADQQAGIWMSDDGGSTWNAVDTP